MEILLCSYVVYIFVVWSRFGQAYQRAVSSLRSARSGQVREEQRRLFGKRKNQSQLSGMPKRSKTVKWTHKFVCLSSTSDEKVPSTYAAKEILLKAGLGEKKSWYWLWDYWISLFVVWGLSKARNRWWIWVASVYSQYQRLGFDASSCICCPQVGQGKDW